MCVGFRAGAGNSAQPCTEANAESTLSRGRSYDSTTCCRAVRINSVDAAIDARCGVL